MKLHAADKSSPTRIIKKLGPTELLALLREKAALEAEYSNHPDYSAKLKTALRYGKSLHILNMKFNGDIIEDRRESFSSTLSLIEQWSGESLDRLARTYWHRLEPGDRIDLHHDDNADYMREVNRYQVYLTVPRDFIVVMDGQLWNVYPEKQLSNTFVQFNLLDWHYYANHSPVTTYMLIADFKKLAQS